jgi:hypothetical protein
MRRVGLLGLPRAYARGYGSGAPDGAQDEKAIFSQLPVPFSPMQVGQVGPQAFGE